MLRAFPRLLRRNFRNGRMRPDRDRPVSPDTGTA